MNNKDNDEDTCGRCGCVKAPHSFYAYCWQCRHKTYEQHLYEQSLFLMTKSKRDKERKKENE